MPASNILICYKSLTYSIFRLIQVSEIYLLNIININFSAIFPWKAFHENMSGNNWQYTIDYIQDLKGKAVIVSLAILLSHTLLYF